MSLNLLGALNEPAIVLDDRALVIGLNSAAAESLTLGRGAAVGKPCFEVLRASDAVTNLPCSEGCSVAKRSTSAWLEVRRLNGLPGQASEMRCVLLRTAIRGDPTTLVLLERGPASGRTGAALADEMTSKVLPALLSITDPADAALVVLGSALRLTAGAAGEVRLAADWKGPLVRRVSIGDLGLPLEPSAAAPGAEAVDDLSLHARRLLISPRRARGDPPLREGPYWAVTAPVHCDSRLAGAITVAGWPPAFSIGQAAAVLCALAGQLGLYLRWLPGNGNVARMRIRALGGFAIEVDGAPVPPRRFRRKSALDVLRLLTAAEGHSLPRTDLAAALWPWVPPAKAAANLRATLHSLRRDLEPHISAGEASLFIDSDRERVGFNRARVWLDTVEFARARTSFLDLARLGYRQEANRAALQALALYRGPFLGDDCRDDPGLAERARLHELFVDLTLRAGQALIAERDYQAAENILRRALAADPAREELHAAMIRLLLETGRGPDAREQLRSCADAVRATAGVDPSAETMSLVGQNPRRNRPFSTGTLPAYQ